MYHMLLSKVRQKLPYLQSTTKMYFTSSFAMYFKFDVRFFIDSSFT